LGYELTVGEGFSSPEKAKPMVSNMPKSKYPKRKRIRLPDKTVYSIPGTLAHIIISTHNKISYFSDETIVTMFQNFLENLKDGKEFKIWAYCIMPDHVHLLLEAGSKGIIEAVKTIKGRFSRKVHKVAREFKWQRSFYDHILRKEETIEKVAYYIWENPIKEGLANSLEEYPFIGGLYKP